MSVGIRTNKTASFDYLGVNSSLTLPIIVLGVTPVPPAGSLGYQLSDQQVYYSNGTEWIQVGGHKYDLELTDAKNVPSLSSEPSISATGDLYVFLANNPGDPTAQRYVNTDGVLTLAAELPVDNDFPNGWDGYASSDFTLFSLVDATFDVTPDNGRLRLFDANFNLIISKTFSVGDAAINGLFTGGFFSSDNKYVLLCYTINNSGPNANTVMYILNVSDLSIYASATLPGFDINTPQLFTVNGQLYVSFMEANGFGDPSTVAPPYYSAVYMVAGGTLTLVDKQLIARFAEKNVVSYGTYALIAHGGFCSLFPDQLSIYLSNVGETTSLPDDNAESRVFTFDGTSLQILVKEAVNCCNRTVIYPPDAGRTYLLGQNTIISEIPPRKIDREFYCLASLAGPASARYFVPMNLPRQDTKAEVPVFSADGNWLIRVGVQSNNGINNIIVLRVIKN